MRVVGSDHLAVFTTLEDEAEEVVALAAGDHLFADINDWQCCTLVFDGGGFTGILGFRHRYRSRRLVGGYSGSQGCKGQKEFTLFHLNIPVSGGGMSRLYRCYRRVKVPLVEVALSSILWRESWWCWMNRPTRLRTRSHR